jgi:putative ABC transport system permease protein
MIRNTLRSAWGSIKRKKMVSLFTVLTISLGMTMIILLASLYNSYTGNVGPYKNRDRSLYLANLKFMRNGEKVQRMRDLHSTAAFINTHLKGLKSPELVGFYGRPVKRWNLGSRYKPFHVKYLETDANFWKIHSFEFVEGRGYSQKEMDNREHVCVISQKAADYLFKGNGAINKYYESRYSNRRYRIVGIIKNVHPHFEVAADIYVPHYLTFWPEDGNQFLDNNKNKVYYNRGAYKGVVLVNKGQSAKEVKTEFEQLVVGQNKQGSFEEFDQLLTHLKTPTELIPGLLFQDDDEMITTIVCLFMGLCFLLVPIVLLSNINFYSLRDRIEEIGVRKSYGASRKVIIVQLLIENIAITFIGGLLAFVLSVPLNKLLVSIIYGSSNVIGMEINMIYFLVLIAGVFVFGVVTVVLPAWRISKIMPAVAINQQLQHTNDRIMAKVRKRWPQVITHFVLFTVVTMCCFFMVLVYVGTFSGMGYNHENVIKLGLWSTSKQDSYPDEYCRNNFNQLKQQVMEVPGVEKVSYVFVESNFWARSQVKNYVLDEYAFELRTRMVDDAFFDLIEMKPIKGQLFSAQTKLDKYIPAVITSDAEDMHFNGDAIGRIVSRKEDGMKLKIIGIIDKYKYSPKATARPVLFSLRNAPSRALMIKYKAGSNTIALEENLKHLVEKSYGGTFRIQESEDMGTEYKEAVNDMEPLFYGVLLIISFLLLNALLGFFVLTWYNVRLRNKELGIRRAIGASKQNIQRKIIIENVSVMLIGVFVSAILTSQVFLMLLPPRRMSFFWNGIIAAAFITVLMTIVSIWLPSIKAKRVHPVEALADE